VTGFGEAALAAGVTGFGEAAFGEEATYSLAGLVFQGDEGDALAMVNGLEEAPVAPPG
jgi:hypothetical protein